MKAELDIDANHQQLWSSSLDLGLATSHPQCGTVPATPQAQGSQLHVQETNFSAEANENAKAISPTEMTQLE